MCDATRDIRHRTQHTAHRTQNMSLGQCRRRAILHMGQRTEQGTIQEKGIGHDVQLTRMTHRPHTGHTQATQRAHTGHTQDTQGTHEARTFSWNRATGCPREAITWALESSASMKALGSEGFSQAIFAPMISNNCNSLCFCKYASASPLLSTILTFSLMFTEIKLTATVNKLLF